MFFCAEYIGNENHKEDICIGAIECTKANLLVMSQRFLADSGSMTHVICNESIKLENEVTTNNKVQGFNGSVLYIK